MMCDVRAENFDQNERKMPHIGQIRHRLLLLKPECRSHTPSNQRITIDGNKPRPTIVYIFIVWISTVRKNVLVDWYNDYRA